jgi:hypothetical protein
MDRWVDGWKCGQMDGYIEGRRISGYMCGRLGGRVEEWTGVCVSVDACKHGWVGGQ